MQHHTTTASTTTPMMLPRMAPICSGVSELDTPVTDTAVGEPLLVLGLVLVLAAVEPVVGPPPRVTTAVMVVHDRVMVCVTTGFCRSRWSETLG